MNSAILGVQALTPEKTQAAMEAGFTYVCSMCIKLHMAKEASGDSWSKARCFGASCCGPAGGAAYPEYEGPLSGSLSKWCFRCGKHDPGHAVSVKTDEARMLGVCEEHLKLLKQGFVRSKPGQPAPENVVEFPHRYVEIKQ